MANLMHINSSLLELEQELEGFKTNNNELKALKEASLGLVESYKENMKTSLELVNKVLDDFNTGKSSLNQGANEIGEAVISAKTELADLIGQIEGKHLAFSKVLDTARVEIEGFDLKEQQAQIEDKIQNLTQASEAFSGTIKSFIDNVDGLITKNAQKVILEQKANTDSALSSFQKAVIDNLHEELSVIKGAIDDQSQQFDQQMANVTAVNQELLSQLSSFRDSVFELMGNHQKEFLEEQKRLLQEKVTTIKQYVAEQDKKLESVIHSEVLEAKYDLSKSIQEQQKAIQQDVQKLSEAVSKAEAQLQDELKASKKLQHILLTVIILQLLLIVAFRFF